VNPTALLLASLLAAPPPAAGAEDSKTAPPRISGVYFGGILNFGVALARVQGFDVDNPHYGTWGGLRVGQAVFPWLTLGVEGSGGVFLYPNEQLWQGGLMFIPAFYPVPKRPFSITLGLGFGAGFVQDFAIGERSGFGGPLFMGALRYEFFPTAARRRPNRKGGFTVGPELSWRGFTPAGPGFPEQPMANTFCIGLWLGHYWGK
jgi:hypothetical protein